MRKIWKSKSFVLSLLALVLCSVLLSAFTISSSASNVTHYTFVPIRGNVQPYIVKVETDNGTYSYYFYDTVYGYEQLTIDTQTLSYSATDDIAYYYTLDSEEMLNEDASIYMRFDRDYSSLGFMYNVETKELISNIRRLWIEDNGDDELFIEYMVDGNDGNREKADYSPYYIVGSMIFEELFEFESSGVTMHQELRHNITVKRAINSDKGTCEFSFSGLGLYDDNLQPYSIEIIDDNATFNKSFERPTMSIYNNSVPINEVYDVRATAYRISYAEDGKEDYYQTYNNIKAVWIYDNFHALPSLANNELHNISNPEFTKILNSNEYIKLTSWYWYEAQGFESYISNTTEFKSTFVISNITFGKPIDESAPFKTILPWDWLNLELDNFDLVTFLDSTTQFLFIDIIGVFSIADIVAIVIGISLLFAFLKLYLGG